MPRRIYQLKATIVGTKPAVWRRVLVSESATLLRLHEVLQAAFGWWDSHLHEFEIDGVRSGPDDGEGWGPRRGANTRLGWGLSSRRERPSNTSTTSATIGGTGPWWRRSSLPRRVRPTRPASQAARPVLPRTVAAWGAMPTSSMPSATRYIPHTTRCSNGWAGPSTPRRSIPATFPTLAARPARRVTEASKSHAPLSPLRRTTARSARDVPFQECRDLPIRWRRWDSVRIPCQSTVAFDVRSDQTCCSRRSTRLPVLQDEGG